MPKVACFHDGECPICNIEINAIKKLDKARNINWVVTKLIRAENKVIITCGLEGAQRFIK
jgi:predicted DCC family thiol-disulfide oxidoreductase YuxK